MRYKVEKEMESKIVFSLIEKHIKLLVPALEDQDIKPINSFSGLGVSSLEKMDLITCITEKLELKIPQSELHRIPTLGALADYLTERKNLSLSNV